MSDTRSGAIKGQHEKPRSPFSLAKTIEDLAAELDLRHRVGEKGLEDQIHRALSLTAQFRDNADAVGVSPDTLFNAIMRRAEDLDA